MLFSLRDFISNPRIHESKEISDLIRRYRAEEQESDAPSVGDSDGESWVPPSAASPSSAVAKKCPRTKQASSSPARVQKQLKHPKRKRQHHLSSSEEEREEKPVVATPAPKKKKSSGKKGVIVIDGSSSVRGCACV